MKQVLGHLTDTERVFSYRALSMARGDRAVLPIREQDPWVPAGRFTVRALACVLPGHLIWHLEVLKDRYL